MLMRLAPATALAAIIGLSALVVPRTIPHANAAGPYKIVLIAGIASDAFYITMNHGAQAEAKKEGATVQFSGSPAAFSPSTQLPYLNAAVAQSPTSFLSHRPIKKRCKLRSHERLPHISRLSWSTRR